MPSPPDPILPPRINVGPNGKGAWRQGGTYGRNDSGYFQTFVFHGTKAEVEVQAGILDLQGCTYEVTIEKGGLASLVARLGANGTGQEVPESIWEIQPQEHQKDLLESDFPFGALLKLEMEEKQIIETAIQGNTTLERARDALFTADFPTTITENMRRYYWLKRSGVRTFPVAGDIIRHTKVVSNTYAVEVSFINAGRILSTSSMNTLEGSGTLFLFTVPTSPPATCFIQTPGDLQYGWRKIKPSVTRQTFTKWQIVQVYEFGLWSTVMYGQVL